ncbi:MAG: hypothetical protein ACRDS0_40200, partial [Pseudonocardiaceae bacterium]
LCHGRDEADRALQGERAAVLLVQAGEDGTGRPVRPGTTSAGASASASARSVATAIGSCPAAWRRIRLASDHASLWSGANTAAFSTGVSACLAVSDRSAELPMPLGPVTSTTR